MRTRVRTRVLRVPARPKCSSRVVRGASSHCQMPHGAYVADAGGLRRRTSGKPTREEDVGGRRGAMQMRPVMAARERETNAAVSMCTWRVRGRRACGPRPSSTLARAGSQQSGRAHGLLRAHVRGAAGGGSSGEALARAGMWFDSRRDLVALYMVSGRPSGRGCLRLGVAIHLFNLDVLLVLEELEVTRARRTNHSIGAVELSRKDDVPGGSNRCG